MIFLKMDSSSSGENGTSRLGLLTLIYLRTVYHIIRAYTSHLMIGTRGIHSKGKCFSTMRLSEWCPMSLTVLFIGNITTDGKGMSSPHSEELAWGKWTIDNMGSEETIEGNSAITCMSCTPWRQGERWVIQIIDIRISYSDHGLLPKHTGQLLQNVSGLVRTQYNGHRSVMKIKRDILLSMSTDIRSVVRQYFSFETMLIRP